jgi:hypothetical protein
VVGCEDPEIQKYTAARDKNPQHDTQLESYQVPADWVRQNQPVELSVATFKVGEGPKTVLVTVSRFPGDGGGLAANIKRWRGKVDLPPLAEEQILKEVKWLKVDGGKLAYVDLADPKKADGKRILGAVARRGPVTWFFKMEGPNPLVGQHKDAFETFVQSLKFAGPGVNDG